MRGVLAHISVLIGATVASGQLLSVAHRFKRLGGPTSYFPLLDRRSP